MHSNHKRFAARILPVVIGIGVIGIGFGAAQSTPAKASSTAPVSCEIEAAKSGGMLALSGVVHSASAASGSYQLKVVSAGGGNNTNINQGGGFSVTSGGSARLGQVTLGDSGAVYEASLKVTVDGKTYSCAERVGGTI